MKHNMFKVRNCDWSNFSNFKIWVICGKGKNICYLRFPKLNIIKFYIDFKIRDQKNNE